MAFGASQHYLPIGFVCQPQDFSKTLSEATSLNIAFVEQLVLQIMSKHQAFIPDLP